MAINITPSFTRQWNEGAERDTEGTNFAGPVTVEGKPISGGGASVAVGMTAPATPQVGDLWRDSRAGAGNGLAYWDGAQWQSVAGTLATGLATVQAMFSGNKLATGAMPDGIVFKMSGGSPSATGKILLSDLPDIPDSRITWGTGNVPASALPQIPPAKLATGISASLITSGVLPIAQVPTIPTTKLSGSLTPDKIVGDTAHPTLADTLIPSLSGTKISGDIDVSKLTDGGASHTIAAALLPFQLGVAAGNALKLDANGKVPASVLNTATAGGTGNASKIPVLDSNGHIDASMLNIGTLANQILKLDANGNVPASTLNGVAARTGAGDASKLIITDGQGYLDKSFLKGPSLTNGATTAANAGLPLLLDGDGEIAVEYLKIDALNFIGTVDATTTGPGTGRIKGDFYITTTGGTPDAGWVGLTGTVETDQALVFDGTAWHKLAASSGQLSAYLKLTGGKLTGVLGVTDGAVGAPGLYFGAATTTGLFTKSGGIGITTTGVERGLFDTNGLTVNGAVIAKPGAAGVPGLSFTGKRTSGIFHPNSGDEIGVAITAVQTFSFQSSLAESKQPLRVPAGAAATAGLQLGAANLGLIAVSNRAHITEGGADKGPIATETWVNAKNYLTAASTIPVAKVSGLEAQVKTWSDALYALKAHTHTVANISDFATGWAAEANKTHSITGAWTFTKVLSGVAPTADAHLATKKYVDDKVAGAGSATIPAHNHSSAATGGTLTHTAISDWTTQINAELNKAHSITGAWSFGSPLTVATPTADGHAATKKYVDDNAGGPPATLPTGTKTAYIVASGTMHTLAASNPGLVNSLRVKNFDTSKVEAGDFAIGAPSGLQAFRGMALLQFTCDSGSVTGNVTTGNSSGAGIPNDFTVDVIVFRMA